MNQQKIEEVFETLRGNPYYNNVFEPIVDRSKEAIEAQNIILQVIDDTQSKRQDLIEIIRQTIKTDDKIISSQIIITILKRHPIELRSQLSPSYMITYQKFFNTVHKIFFQCFYTAVPLFGGSSNKKASKPSKQTIPFRIYDFDNVFEDSEGKAALITETGNRKRIAQELNPYMRTCLRLTLECNFINWSDLAKSIYRENNIENLCQFYLNHVYMPEYREKKALKPLVYLLRDEKHVEIWLNVFDGTQMKYNSQCFFDTINQLIINQKAMFRYCIDLLEVLKQFMSTKQIFYHLLQKIQAPSGFQDLQRQLQNIIIQGSNMREEFSDNLLKYLQQIQIPKNQKTVSVKDFLFQTKKYIDNQMGPTFLTSFSILEYELISTEISMKIFDLFQEAFVQRKFNNASSNLELLIGIRRVFDPSALCRFQSFFQKNLQEIFYVHGHIEAFKAKSSSNYQNIFKVSALQAEYNSNHFFPYLVAYKESFSGQPEFVNADKLFNLFQYMYDTSTKLNIQEKSVCHEILKLLDQYTSIKPLKKLHQQIIQKNLGFLQINAPLDYHFAILLEQKQELLKKSETLIQLQLFQNQEVRDIQEYQIYLLILEKQVEDPKEFVTLMINLMESLKVKLKHQSQIDQIRFLIIKSIFKKTSQDKIHQLLVALSLFTLEDYELIKIYILSQLIRDMNEYGINIIPILVFIALDDSDFIQKRVEQIQQEFLSYFNTIEESSMIYCLNFLIYLIEIFQFSTSNADHRVIIFKIIKNFVSFMIEIGKQQIRKQGEMFALAVQICLCLKGGTLKSYQNLSFKCPKLKDGKQQKLFEKYPQLNDFKEASDSRDQLFNYIMECFSIVFRTTRKEFQQQKPQQPIIPKIDPDLYTNF